MSKGQRRSSRSPIARIGYTDRCLTSCPCVHDVRIEYQNGIVRSASMDGREIARMYAKNGLKIPSHFAQYVPEDKRARLEHRIRKPGTPRKKKTLLAPRPRTYPGFFGGSDGQEIARVLWEAENVLYFE